MSTRRQFLAQAAALPLVPALGGAAAAAPAGPKAKFAVISDCHLALAEQKGVADGFKLGRKTRMLTENTVAAVNRIEGLDFVLVGGDLTQDAEPWNIDVVRRVLDGLKVPYYAVLGNHDVSPVPHDEKDQPVTLSKYVLSGAFVGEHGGMSPGNTYYAREVVPGLVLVALDSTRPQVYVPETGLNDYGGEVDAAQMRWLDATLAANKGKAVIVLTHHSAVHWHPAERSKDHNHWRWFWMDNGPEVARLLGKHKVRAVFSGHRHISTRFQRVHGVHHFVHPALSTYPMRFAVYEMDGHGLKWETRNVPASREVWEVAKSNFLATKWWRGPDHPATPEGDRRYLGFYESPATMKGQVRL